MCDSTIPECFFGEDYGDMRKMKKKARVLSEDEDEDDSDDEFDALDGIDPEEVCDAVCGGSYFQDSTFGARTDGDFEFLPVTTAIPLSGEDCIEYCEDEAEAINVDFEDTYVGYTYSQPNEFFPFGPFSICVCYTACDFAWFSFPNDPDDNFVLLPENTFGDEPDCSLLNATVRE